MVQFAERDTSDLSKILIRTYDRDVCNRHPDRKVGMLDVGQRRKLWYQIPNFDRPELSQGEPPMIGARIVAVREGKVLHGEAFLGLDVDVGGGRIIRVWQSLNGQYARLFGRHWLPQGGGDSYTVSIRVARSNQISPNVFEAGDWVGLFLGSRGMEKAVNGEADAATSYHILVDG